MEQEVEVNSVGQYREMAGREGTWGTDYECLGAAELYDRLVVVSQIFDLQADGTVVVLRTTFFPPRFFDTIYTTKGSPLVLYNNGVHFTYHRNDFSMVEFAPLLQKHHFLLSPPFIRQHIGTCRDKFVFPPPPEVVRRREAEKEKARGQALYEPSAEMEEGLASESWSSRPSSNSLTKDSIFPGFQAQERVIYTKNISALDCSSRGQSSVPRLAHLP